MSAKSSGEEQGTCVIIVRHGRGSRGIDSESVLKVTTLRGVWKSGKDGRV